MQYLRYFETQIRVSTWNASSTKGLVSVSVGRSNVQDLEGSLELKPFIIQL